MGWVGGRSPRLLSIRLAARVCLEHSTLRPHRVCPRAQAADAERREQSARSSSGARKAEAFRLRNEHGDPFECTVPDRIDTMVRAAPRRSLCAEPAPALHRWPNVSAYPPPVVQVTAVRALTPLPVLPLYGLL